MCLGLPALLQRLDGVDAQHGLCPQGPGFVNHCVACLQTLFLQAFQRACRVVDGGLPERLQLGKHLFANVASLTPAISKLVQHAAKAFPVVVQRDPVGLGPGLDFLDQGQALGTVLGRLGLHFFEPGLDHLVGFVAGFIKALPEHVVGHAALVGQLPLFAQATQEVLHFATANGLAFGTFEQALGFGHQFLTQLVGAPALPALEFTRCHQRRMRLGFELVINQATVVLERLTQGIGCTSAGFAMALGHLMFQLGQHFCHVSSGFGANFGVHFGFGLRHGRLQRQTSRQTQLIGPHRYLGQGRCRVLGGGNGECQGILESLPNQLQLGLGIVQLGHKTNVHTGPVGIGHQCIRLGLPMRDIGGQSLLGGLGIGPG